MKISGIIFSLVLLSQVLFSQIEYKYNTSQNDDIPHWAQLMYSTADPAVVVKEYEEYYKNNVFIKNQHTQYYKRWMVGISRAVHHDKPNPRLQNDGNVRTNDWSCIGPFDWDHSAAGRSYAPGSAHVYTVEQSISTPNTLYAGTANAGIWKSTDRGENWTQLSYNLDLNTVYALEIDYANPNIVYADMFNSIYKTTNGGSNWNPTGDAAFQALSLSVKDIVMDPTSTSRVLAATSGGLYRTTNGGTTWTQIVSGDFQEIEFHPTNANIVYAVRNNGNNTSFFRSLNNGLTFSQVGNGWPNPNTGAGEHQRRAEISVSLDSPDYVYAHTTGSANGGSGLYGIYVSSDQGMNWTFNCCGPQPAGPPNLATGNINIMAWNDDGSDDGGQYYYDVGFAVSPTNSDTMFASGVNMWVSGNGGVNFTCPAKWSQPDKPNYVHADIHDIHYYSHTHEIWVACDGGIFKSTDNGANFIRKVVGIAGSDFWGFGQGWWDGDIMLGGAYHNGTLLKENDVYINGWLCTDGGDGNLGFVNPGRSRNVHSWFNIKDLKSNRTIDPPTRGNSHKPNASYITGEDSDILFHPNYYDTWWVGSDNFVYYTKDNGYTFETLANLGAKVVSMDHCYNNTQVIYASTWPGWWDKKKIFRSDDGGHNWTDITPSDAILVNNNWVPYDIAVDPNDAMKVYILRTSMYGDTDMGGRTIFSSNNGGVTWSNITGTLPNIYPTNIALQYGSNEGIYIGTRKGLWYRSNVTNWTNISSDLPTSTFSEKIVPYYRKSSIRNATNRSVWQRAMVVPSQPMAMPSVQSQILSCTQDTAYFVDHSVLAESGASWTWSFPGGSPASSTERSPKVTYMCPGVYDVSLTVSDVNGSSSKVVSKMIKVLEDCEHIVDPGKALSTSASGQYVNVNNVNWNTNNFTITAWVKPNGVQSDYSGIVMADGTAAGFNFKSNNMIGYHWPSGSQWAWNSNLFAPAGVWSYVALVVTPTKVTAYVNGIAASNNVTTDPVQINSLKIGSYQGWNDRNYKGLIDEVCIWNRALSQNEIREKRHLIKNVNAEVDLLAYYKFNESSTTVKDYANGHNGNLNSSATTVTSAAPIGVGTFDRMAISSLGTFTFPNAEATMTFANGTTPNGDVVLTHLLNKPNYIDPSSKSMTRGYYILNNYGSNNTFTGLSSMELNHIGTISQYMVNNSVPKLEKRSDNSDASSWNFIMDSPATLNSGNQGSITYTSMNGLFNSSGQFEVSRADFPVAEPQVSFVASTTQPTAIVAGASVALNINSQDQVLTLPLTGQNDLELIGNPVPGLISYDTVLNTIVYFYNNSWFKINEKQVYSESNGPTIVPQGIDLSSSRDSSSLLNLSTSQGFVLLPSYNNEDLKNIAQPNNAMMIFNGQEGKIQVFDGYTWSSLQAEGLSLRSNNANEGPVPGFAVGMSSKDKNAAMQISNAEFKTLSLPLTEPQNVYHPKKGALTYDPSKNEYMIFDGQNWKKLMRE